MRQGEGVIVGAENAELYVDWINFIQVPETRDAFRFLVGAAATSEKYACSIQRSGATRDFIFKRNGQMPYAFITNHRWLLFYFRAPALNAGTLSKHRLARDFIDFKDNPNQKTEWTVRLRSIEDVKRLLTHIDLT